MASNFTDVRVLMAAMDMLESDILNAVGKAVTENINLMEADVKSNAPKAGDQTPKIHGGSATVDYNIASYTYKQDDGNGNAEFGIAGEAADIAAYVEFGTGTDAKSYVPSIESAFQAQALQFYKNGKGSIAHVPFFLPAWYKIKDKLLVEAQANINKIDVT